MMMRIVVFFCIIFFSPQPSSCLAPEKRIQMCQAMQESLKPRVPKHWHVGKVAISGIAALTAAITITMMEDSSGMRGMVLRNFNRVVQLQLRVNRFRANLDSFLPAIIKTPPEAERESFPSSAQTIVFCTTSALVYFLLTALGDPFIKSHTSTLKLFLNEWPDYAPYAPQKLREEAALLFGALLRDGDKAIPNEYCAKLILQAFNIFLIEEIELLSQSLV